jgi:hypothetical protein
MLTKEIIKDRISSQVNDFFNKNNDFIQKTLQEEIDKKLSNLLSEKLASSNLLNNSTHKKEDTKPKRNAGYTATSVIQEKTKDEIIEDYPKIYKSIHDAIFHLIEISGCTKSTATYFLRKHNLNAQSFEQIKRKKLNQIYN